MEVKSYLVIFLLLIGGYTYKAKATTTLSATPNTSTVTTTPTIPTTTSTQLSSSSSSSTPQMSTETSTQLSTTQSSTTQLSSSSTTTTTTTVSTTTTNGPINYTVLSPRQREVAGIEMYFREGPSMSSAPVFNVYLGDAFYMFIRYTGSYHVIKPVECKAYAGVVIDANVTNMVFWNRFKCSTVDGILEDFRNESNTLLSATIYGFHFYQSPYVTIECTVCICDPNSGCATSEICPSTQKKRMMAHNPSSLGKKSFRVVSGVRNTGKPNETSSLWLYTICWMFASAVYI